MRQIKYSDENTSFDSETPINCMAGSCVHLYSHVNVPMWLYSHVLLL